MNRYDKTYRRYCALMQRLRIEFCELDSLMNISIGGKRISSILDDINMTILTAENGINVPSAELYSITNEMADLRKYTTGLVNVSSDSWKKCFVTLHEASVELQNITDDPYVQHSRKLSKEFI